MQQQTVLSELDFIFTPRVESKQTFPLYDCLALTKLCQNQSGPSHLTAMFSLQTILIVFPQCDRQKVHPNIFQVLPQIFSFFLLPISWGSSEQQWFHISEWFGGYNPSSQTLESRLWEPISEAAGPIFTVLVGPRQGLKRVLGSIPVHTEHRCLFFP